MFEILGFVPSRVMDVLAVELHIHKLVNGAWAPDQCAACIWRNKRTLAPHCVLRGGWGCDCAVHLGLRQRLGALTVCFARVSAQKCGTQLFEVHAF